MASSGSSATAAVSTTRVVTRASGEALAAQVGILVGLGLLGALLHTALKLRLGIPGHAAVLWLTPILLGRSIASIAPAASVASTSLAAGLFAFGGFSLQWPLVLSFGAFWLTGPVVDLALLFLQSSRRGTSLTGRWGCLLLPLAGIVGNLSHLALKLIFGVMRPHEAALGLPPAAYVGATYIAFGLAAGALAFAFLRSLGTWRR